MASLPVKDEGGSGALDTILGSPIEPKLQNLDSSNPAGLVPTDTGLPHHRRPLPPETSSVQSILQSQSQQRVATLLPPAGQFLINTLLQAAGIAAVIAFGVYAVKSVTVGNSANQYADQAVRQAVTANQLAILAVCLSNGTQTADIASICSRVVSGAASVLPNAASMLFPNLPTSTSTASTTSQPFTTPTVATPTPTPTSTPTASLGASGTGATIGIVIGAIMGVILLSIVFCVTIRARRRGLLDVEADSPMSDLRGIVKVFRKLFVDSQVITHME